MQTPAVCAAGVMRIVRGKCECHHQRLDQHDRAVDDDPEVHCPERDQIRRHAARVHQNESEQQ
jgi:hypothetical protein